MIFLNSPEPVGADLILRPFEGCGKSRPCGAPPTHTHTSLSLKPLSTLLKKRQTLQEVQTFGIRSKNLIPEPCWQHALNVVAGVGALETCDGYMKD